MNVTTIPNTATAVAALTTSVSTLQSQVAALQANAGSVTIYRPGGVASGNVYTTLLAAVNAASRPGGVVLIDRSLGAAVAAAVEYNVDGLVIEGIPIAGVVGAGLSPTLTIPAGATFVAATYRSVAFRSVKLAFTGSAPLLSVGASGLLVTMEQYATIDTTGATGVFFDSQNGDLFIDVGYGCGLAGSSGHEAINLGAGGSCELFFRETNWVATSLTSNTIKGGGAGAYTITDCTTGLTALGGAATISHTQTADTPTYLP